jgi:cyanophycinase-like exopeptidase
MTTTMPRLLVLIGSGETAAQMARGHRMIAQRLAHSSSNSRIADVRAAIIDTPYGFQSNADAESAQLLDFFGRRIGLNASIASFRRGDIDPLSRETALKAISDADFVFSGPGSPSYALRQWTGTRIPELFVEKLNNGGALLLASAAALTAGRLTLPVYEIYKAGDDPFWLPGLDVLSRIGISAAVVPHYDNGEGADHDTRFCFIGEARLQVLEEQLPDDVFILGIDEHTALMLDLEAATAQVHGRGGVTIRRNGDSRFFQAGGELPFEALTEHSATSRSSASPEPAQTQIDDHAGLARRIVELEAQLWAAQSRAGLFEPLVEGLLEARQTARSQGDYLTADAIRDRLLSTGVEIVDSGEGPTTYRLR